MSKEEISFIDSALGFFDSFYKLDLASKAYISFDDLYVKKQIDKIMPLMPHALTDKDLVELEKKIKSIYAIYQPEGVAILGDYEHRDDWYDESEQLEQFFWDRYKRHLLNEGLPPSVVERLENDTLNNLMSYLGNPAADEQFSRKGLVIGDVQSGKTANYIGLICKAIDAGYKVVFLLTGTIESLRRQTQIRVEEGFIGYDIVNGEEVGVGKGKILPLSFTSRERDFVKGAEANTALLIQDDSPIPYIFVIKKNVSVLKKIHAAIKA